MTRDPRSFAPLALAAALLASNARAQGSDFETRPIVVTREQEEAVERGLQWLAENQNPNGSWDGKIGYKLNSDYRETGDGSHVGVTALACMAFLAGGHLPARGTYGDVVNKGLDFVLNAADEDGYVTYNGTRMYSHAFATLFLAEIYGMTHHQEVRRKLQKAVDFIVTTQNNEGGWRYVPFAPESDMSIVVCQVLALRAARNIGIRVPKATIDRAAQYVVDSAITENSRRSSFSSTMYPDEIGSFHYQRGRGSRSSFPLTAAGVTALHGVGIYSDDAIRRGLDYLRKNLIPFNNQYGKHDQGHYFFWYGHYYGVQAMYTAGTSSQGTTGSPTSRRCARAARHAAPGRLLAEPHGSRPGLRHGDGGPDPRDPLPLPPDLPTLERPSDVTSTREAPIRRLEGTPALERLLGRLHARLARQVWLHGLGTVLFVGVPGSPSPSSPTGACASRTPYASSTGSRSSGCSRSSRGAGSCVRSSRCRTAPASRS